MGENVPNQPLPWLIPNHRKAPTCVTLTTEKTRRALPDVVVGELQQHKEPGEPKAQTCRHESSPWEMLHLVDATVGGLE